MEVCIARDGRRCGMHAVDAAMDHIAGATFSRYRVDAHEIKRVRAHARGGWHRASVVRGMSTKQSLVARFLALLALVSVITALSACNTSRGIGEDLETAGEEIQEEATD